MSAGVVAARRAIVLSLVVVAVFEAALYISKETPAVYDHAPWLNDPYDTAVSFALFCLPIVAVPSMLRLLAGHDNPLSPGRLRDLIRACGVALAAITLTLAACWAAVATSANRAAWTSVTAVQVVALALISGGIIVSGARLRLAAGAMRRAAAAPHGDDAADEDPDWLGDMIDAGLRLAALTGPAGRPARRALDLADANIVPGIRRHPVMTAAAVAGAVGALVAVAQSVREGYRPGVAIVFFAITAAGIFAFVVTAGWYLRVVRATPPGRGRAAVVRAGVLAAAAVPVTLAFRAALWTLVGARPDGNGLPALCLLLAAGAVGTFTASLATEHASRALRGRRPR